MHTAYTAFGSSRGDREGYIATAFSLLHSTLGITIAGVSPIYESMPLGTAASGFFLNGCAELRTTLQPIELFRELKRIEAETGRKDRERWADREIDLDLIFYDDEILQTEELTLPHPAAHVRDFVLRPLADLAPSFVHPVLQKTVAELLDSLAGGYILRPVEPALHQKLFTSK